MLGHGSVEQGYKTPSVFVPMPYKDLDQFYDEVYWLARELNQKPSEILSWSRSFRFAMAKRHAKYTEDLREKLRPKTT